MKAFKSIPAIPMLISLLMSMPGWAAEIAITANSQLAFGTFAAGSGGSITVSTRGSCSAGGGVIIVNHDCSHAEFLISGDPNLSYIIELPVVNFVTLTGPGTDMVISNFFSDPAAGANGLLDSNGSQTLSVGGTLNVGDNQPAGSYSGSFSIIVQYN